MEKGLENASLHTHVCDLIPTQVDVGERPVGLQGLRNDLPIHRISPPPCAHQCQKQFPLFSICWSYIDSFMLSLFLRLTWLTAFDKYPMEKGLENASLHTHVCDLIPTQVDVSECPVGLQGLRNDLPIHRPPLAL